MLYTKAMKTKSGKICRSEEWYHTFRYFHSRMVKQKHVLEDIPRSVKMMALMQAFYFFQFSCNREVLFVSPSWETSLPRSHGNHHPTKDKDTTTPCFSATSFRKPPFQLLSLNQIQTWKPTRNLRGAVTWSPWTFPIQKCLHIEIIEVCPEVKTEDWTTVFI